ncbi:hypothetical protein [Salisediminibacterium halotolerans]|uniref:hypothetical protein n=1 Tax=Salisediminibacterium halotolerans TaxID=517425 RepID=UPI000F26CA89|nr:hypothetical protein [Salisediminibacterium halotolerans]RLJ78318.1 hypothetical protein BCL39_0790 [Actinophytocola xinjiangensis]RPE88343.1 hypothetical protein EDD67_0669 [Salisediminibacterium halotolerans]TWG37294.1 hypothetical protein BCL52_0788 [Salisediminibacterium halotolerans]GEL08758.1 hypothetical protein SHA02_21740 [Salisediminibacterium halotolerans]
MLSYQRYTPHVPLDGVWPVDHTDHQHRAFFLIGAGIRAIERRVKNPDGIAIPLA